MTQLPNFIIFGSTKSGSTSLCNYLIQHPDIFISKKKEPNFFLHDEGSTVTDASGQKIDYTLSWYSYWFRHAHQPAVGEASVSYLASETAPHRIKQMLPQVRLIAILREPVSRLYSHYWFEQRRTSKHQNAGSNTSQSSDILTALHNDRNQGSPLRYFEKGLYYRYLKRYFDLFERQQIRLFLFEDFTADPLGVSQEIFRFLEVDPSFVPVTGAKDAASGIPKNQRVYNFLYRDNPVRVALRPVIRTLLPNQEKRRALWTRLVNWNLSRPSMDEQTKQTLAEMYRSDVLKLQDLIDRDLSRWLA